MTTTTSTTILLCFLPVLLFLHPATAFGFTRFRELFLSPEEPIILDYHGGDLLKGPYAVNLIWYGLFTPVQRTIVNGFVESLSPTPSQQYPPPPSVASWWATTEDYGEGATVISLGTQVLKEDYELGRSLSLKDLETLALMAPLNDSINVVLTASDVTVDGFCRSRCGLHKFAEGPAGSAYPYGEGRLEGSLFPYIWVGNSVTQCPGKCAWPFAQPMHGPQISPLVPPSGDFGVDGMIINLAKLLAGTVTNPYDGGYFHGPDTGSVEAATACTGMFGKGAFPGYAGEVLVDTTTGGSYNARGLNGREFLLPAMWDPKTSSCTTVI